MSAIRNPIPPPRQERAHITRGRLLDAAVDELVERGYAGFTTPSVAARAGVSRGAQQNHFPHKSVLIVEAVRHLATRQIHELRSRVADVPPGRRRVELALEILLDQYSGPLFVAVIDLSLAARNDAYLRAVVTAEERNIAREVQHSAKAIFGESFPKNTREAERWSMVLSTIRGLALLKLLGHSSTSVSRQWTAVRPQLLKLLMEGI